MLKVFVCPNCKKISVYRKKGKCRYCGQSIAINKEFWGEDDIWTDKKGTNIAYKEGIKLALDK